MIGGLICSTYNTFRVKNIAIEYEKKHFSAKSGFLTVKDQYSSTRLLYKVRNRSNRKWEIENRKLAANKDNNENYENNDNCTCKASVAFIGPTLLLEKVWFLQRLRRWGRYDIGFGLTRYFLDSESVGQGINQAEFCPLVLLKNAHF